MTTAIDLKFTVPPSPSLLPSADLAVAFLKAFVVLLLQFPTAGGRGELRLDADSRANTATVTDDELARAFESVLKGELPSLLMGRCAEMDMAGRLTILIQLVDARSSIAHPSVTTATRTRPSLTGSMEFDLWIDRYNTDGFFADVVVEAPGLQHRYVLVPRGPLRSDDDRKADERGGSIQDLASYLCVLGPSSRWTADLVRNESRANWSGPSVGLRDAIISAVPVCVEPGDVEIEVVGNHISPRPAPHVDMTGLVADVFYEAQTASAGMVVFPEFVAGRHVSEPLSVLLSNASTKSGAGRPGIWICGSSLSLDDQGRTRNRSIVLDGDGRPIGIPQDKLNLNHVDAITLDKWAPGASPRSGGFQEKFDCGDRVLVIDDSLWGRIVVLICEDLKQPDPRSTLCRNLRPDWVIAPILDGTVHETNHWAEASAAQASLDSDNHSRVLVVNSLSLSLHETPSLNPVPFAIAVDRWTKRMAWTPAEQRASENEPWRPRRKILRFNRGSMRSATLSWTPNDPDWSII